MEPEQVQLLVLQVSGAFSALFDFMFDGNIVVLWGPPFALYIAINLMRIALGRGYAPGPAELESYGERLLRDEVKRGNQ